jgi:hypothetical protein
MVSKNLRVSEGQTGTYLIALDWDGFGWGSSAPVSAITAAKPDVYLSYIKKTFSRPSWQVINETSDIGKLFRCFNQ